jgi:hypothetical protein
MRAYLHIRNSVILVVLAFLAARIMMMAVETLLFLEGFSDLAFVAFAVGGGVVAQVFVIRFWKNRSAFKYRQPHAPQFFLLLIATDVFLTGYAVLIVYWFPDAVLSLFTDWFGWLAIAEWLAVMVFILRRAPSRATPDRGGGWPDQSGTP